MNILRKKSIFYSGIFDTVIKVCTFVTLKNTVVLAQLVRASVCGTEGRGFEPHIPPMFKSSSLRAAFFV